MPLTDDDVPEINLEFSTASHGSVSAVVDILPSQGQGRRKKVRPSL